MPARASCSPAGSPERRPGDERLIVWAFLAGGLLLFGLFALARGFGSAKPADIAFAVRTFVAVVSGLASTGLLLQEPPLAIPAFTPLPAVITIHAREQK